MLSLFLVALNFVSSPSLAACPQPTFTPPEEMHLHGKKLLIVTHTSTVWDEQKSSKAGMDKAVKIAKSKKIPVVYLQDDSDPDTYFYNDCSPTYYYSSRAGEFDFAFDAVDVVDVGGHFEECESLSMQTILRVMGIQHPKENIRVTQYVEGIYTHGAFNDQRFPNASAYENLKKKRGWKEDDRVSVYDLLKLIQFEADKIDYLTRQVHRLEMPTTHNVVIGINGVKKSIYREVAVGAPVLTLNFVTKRVDEAPEFLAP